MANKKQSGGNKKAGRNKEKCAVYALSGRREANKARKADIRARKLAKARENRERREAEAAAQAARERAFQDYWGFAR